LIKLHRELEKEGVLKHRLSEAEVAAWRNVLVLRGMGSGQNPGPVSR